MEQPEKAKHIQDLQSDLARRYAGRALRYAKSRRGSYTPFADGDIYVWSFAVKKCPDEVMRLWPLVVPGGLRLEVHDAGPRAS